MASSLTWLWEQLPGDPYRTIILTLGAAYILPKALRLSVCKLGALFRSRPEPPPSQRDVVHLCVFPRSYARQHLNLSPFAVKLETWLRLYKIPYKLIETSKFSPTTGKTPYIYYNGHEVADSARILEFLVEQFGLDPLEGGTTEEQAVTRAFHRMADESLAPTYFLFRYHYLSDQFISLFRISKSKRVSKMVLQAIGRKQHRRALDGSIGRHVPTDVGHVAQQDIRAISAFLGTKPFMFGDQPRTLDCVIFAHLSQFVYVDLDYPHKVILESECTNILPYFERMKARLWPDWESIVNCQPFG